LKGSAGAFDLLEDVGGRGSPDRGLGVLIVMVSVFADSLDQLLHSAEDTSTQPILGQVTEECSTVDYRLLVRI
jgi:hypothetical protein